MSEKVKLPREVAEAIEYAKVNLQWTDGNILAKCVRGDWDLEVMQIFNKFCIKDDNKLLVASALINGYEVEETPEEVVQRIFEKREGQEGSINSEVRKDIVEILDAYKIKVKGVNAWDF